MGIKKSCAASRNNDGPRTVLCCLRKLRQLNPATFIIEEVATILSPNCMGPFNEDADADFGDKYQAGSAVKPRPP
jgi:hypothetical protein